MESQAVGVSLRLPKSVPNCRPDYHGICQILEAPRFLQTIRSMFNRGFTRLCTVATLLAPGDISLEKRGWDTFVKLGKCAKLDLDGGANSGWNTLESRRACLFSRISDSIHNISYNRRLHRNGHAISCNNKAISELSLLHRVDPA